jgi:O-antigen ligase
MVGSGVLFTLLIEPLGLSVVLIVPALIVLVFVLPASLGQAVTRFRDLRKRLTWLHVLWLFVFLSGFQFRLRDVQDIANTAVDSGALYRIALMAITVVGLGAFLVLKQFPRLRLSFRGLVGLLATYAMVSVTSALWSVYPAWTLYKSFEYLIDVVLLAAILAAARSTRAYKTLLDWTWTLTGLLLACVWLGVLAWPGEALQPSRGLISFQLNGVMPQVSANGVGEMAAVMAIVALSRLLLRRLGNSGRAFYSVLLVLALATMVVAQTRSAIIGFFLGFVLLLYFSKRLGTISLLIAVVILVASLVDVGGLAEEYLRRGQNDELVTNLTGRTIWWEATWDVFVKNMWLGAGAFTSRFTVLAKLRDLDVPNVHNTFLETLVGVGIVGLLPVLAALLGAWKILLGAVRQEWCRSLDRQLAVEALAVLAIITCRSFFTASLVMHPDLESLAVLGCAELLRQRSKQGEYRCNEDVVTRNPELMIPGRYSPNCK